MRELRYRYNRSPADRIAYPENDVNAGSITPVVIFFQTNLGLKFVYPVLKTFLKMFHVTASDIDHCLVD